IGPDPKDPTKVRMGGKIPTLAPNPKHGGEKWADALFIHGMDPTNNDPKHGGKDYQGSDGCQGPPGWTAVPTTFTKESKGGEGNTHGDRGHYLLIRPAEGYERLEGLVRGFMNGTLGQQAPPPNP